MLLWNPPPAAAQQTRWYFAEGATGPAFEQDIIVVNPTALTAEVQITFLKGSGTPQVMTFLLPATTRKSVRVNAVPGLEATEVSTIVESLNGVAIAAERTMYWGGATKRGGHHSIGVEEAETEWFLAEGATGTFFHTYILLANPGAVQATVTARFLRDDATVVTRSYQVDPHRRFTIDVNADTSLTNTSFGTHITSTQPILVERAMYWSSFEGGSDANAVAALSTTWIFAEGTTGSDFHTYLLLSNPGSTAATANAVFYPETGPTVTRSVSVAPSSRTTIDANAILELTGKNFATTITSSVPIVAERAMYWGNFVDGHATAGVTQTATKWGFAEGRTGVHESVGFETFYLLLNSSSSALPVRGTFYLEDGTGSVLDFTIPPNARYTLNAAEPPRMAGKVLSAFFEAAAPFVAERATYWGAGWYGGHGSTGIPWTGPIAEPAALPSAAAPTFTPAAGTYHADMSLSLATTTPGAIIRYTRNGVEPDGGSTPYSGPIAVNETSTIKAKAFHPDYQSSVTATGLFTLQAEPPTFDRPAGEYPSPTQFALGTTLPNAYIRYTTDGSEPNDASLLYTQPIPAPGPMTLTIKARVYRYNWTPSAPATAVYQITQGQLATPVPTPAAGIYAPGQTVTLSAQPGIAIRYTLDGSDPTELSALYSTALVLQEPTTVKARAFGAGYSPSPLLTARFDMRIATPELTPGDGPLDFGGSTVSLVNINPDLTYRYTLDSEDPTEQSPQFYGGHYLYVGQTIKVSAFKSGWLPSEPASTSFWSATRPVSPGIFTSSGGAPTGFNPLSTFVSFTLQNTFLDQSSVLLMRNGAVAQQSMAVSHAMTNGVASSLATVPSLADGRNELSIYATDVNGLEVHGRTVLWAGSRSANVYVQRSSGAALPGAQVRLVLLEDEAVSADGLTDGGGAFTAQNLPSSVGFRVEVSASGYHARVATLAPGASSVTVALSKNNLGFGDGTEGWQGPVESMAHSETSDPLEYCVGPCPGGFRGQPPTLAAVPDALDEPVVPNIAPCEPYCDFRQLLRQTVGVSTNMDVLLRTGWQTSTRAATYTFTPTLGTRLVRVRYRIQSAEIMPHPPWNPVGLPVPDRYLVRLRSTTTSETRTDAGTVKDLYWNNHLDNNQATPWRTLEVPIEDDGESVELRLEVQNAWDAAWDTGIWVDRIEEQSYRIDAFELYDYKLARHTSEGVGGRLEFLSAARHTYYNGNTNLNGTISISAPPGAQVSGVSLEILKDATVIATGTLVSGLAPQLLRTVGSDGIVSQTQSVHMFGINSAQFDALTLDDELNLNAQVRVTFANGTVLTKKLGRPLIALALYRGINRYPVDRDAADCIGTKLPAPCGGDDWARPRTVRFIAAVGQNTTWGDFSNMNGGVFPDHNTHRNGLDVDGFFPRYPDRDALTAQRLIGFLNQYGRKIARVFVTFPVNPPGPFLRAIEGVQLNDGRPATAVIRPVGGHAGHFHWLLDLSQIP